jgi:hypothetical protein
MFLAISNRIKIISVLMTEDAYYKQKNNNQKSEKF